VGSIPIHPRHVGSHNLRGARGVHIAIAGVSVRLSWLGAFALIGAFAICAAACGLNVATRASGPRTAATPQPSGPSGVIQGSVAYPADNNPNLLVYALAIDGSRFYSTEKLGYGAPAGPVDQEWTEYRLLGVAPGDYFVLTIPSSPPYYWETASGARTGGALHFGAGYTKAVPCGLTSNCTDHSLVPVHVSAGATLTGIDPLDWAHAPDAYPLVPGGAPAPPSVVSTPPSSFSDPIQAATYVVGANFVVPSSGCQVNRACASLPVEHDGHAAAYVTSQVGTNGLLRTCTVYVISTTSGWQILDWNCKRLTEAFPGVGSSGHLDYSAKFEDAPRCINIHSTPGLTAKVVACVPVGTAVAINDGPTYLPEATSPRDDSLNVWWDIANRGWVVHHYLVWGN
jgi:hypothetical protein